MLQRKEKKEKPQKFTNTFWGDQTMIRLFTELKGQLNFKIGKKHTWEGLQEHVVQ